MRRIVIAALTCMATFALARVLPVAFWASYVPPPPAGGNYAVGSNGGVTNYVSLDNESLYDFPYNQDCSLDFWIKTTHAGGWVTIMGKTTDGPNHGLGWSINYHGKDRWLDLNFRGSDNSQMDDIGATNISDGTWHYVVAVYRGSEGQAQTNANIYCDGVALPKITSVGPLTASGSNTEAVTFLSDGDTAGIAATIDEVRFYNKALTPVEIGQAFNATNRFCNTNSAPYSTGLISYWHTDEGTGTKTYGGKLGESGTYTGTLTGVSWETGFVEAP